MTDASNSDEFVGEAAEDTSNNYSVSKYYTSARDKKGFSTTVRVSIPPVVMSNIASFVATQRIPEYKTSQDVLRDALVHRLQWLRDNVDSLVLNDAAKMLIMETRSEQYLRHREAVAKHLRNYEDAFRLSNRNDQVMLLKNVTADLADASDDTLREGLLALVQRYS